jgi:hypothetical protein
MRKYKHLHQKNTTQLAKYVCKVINWGYKQRARFMLLSFTSTEEWQCFIMWAENMSSPINIRLKTHLRKYEHMATPSLGVSTLELCLTLDTISWRPSNWRANFAKARTSKTHFSPSPLPPKIILQEGKNTEI